MKLAVNYFHPSRIIAGNGSIEAVGKHAAALSSSVLLVTGANSLRKSGHLDTILANLKSSIQKVYLFDRVSHEADIEYVREGVEICRREKIGCVIGVGGGSVIDTAKVIAGLTLENGDPSDYHGKNQPTGAALPFIAAPTTAGTGAEVTNNGVISDYSKKLKESIRHPNWLARVVIADPELTLNLTPAVTATSGADALVQAIEAYISKGSNFISDAQALAAVKLIFPSLLKAYREGSSLRSRENMLYGSLLGGLALSHARLGAVHGMAHPIGIYFDLPHGLACGTLFPYVMQKNLEVCEEKFVNIFKILELDTMAGDSRARAETAVDSVTKLFMSIGIPRDLSAYDKPEVSFDSIVAPALKSGSTMHNPREMQARDFQDILAQVFPRQ